MFIVLGDDAVPICERPLRRLEIDTVFHPIRPVLGGIPVETDFGQKVILPHGHTKSHTVGGRRGDP
jgi:hypothetical protein